MWGCSSDGRARRSQRRGQGFDPPHLHHTTEIILVIADSGLWNTKLVHAGGPQGGQNHGKKENYISFLSSIHWDVFQTNFKEDLAKSNYHNVSKYVTALVEDLNLDVKEESETYRKQCRGMLKAQNDLLGICQRRQNGDYEYEKRFIQAPISAVNDTTPSDRISGVTKHYVSDRVNGGISPVWIYVRDSQIYAIF